MTGGPEAHHTATPDPEMSAGLRTHLTADQTFAAALEAHLPQVHLPRYNSVTDLEAQVHPKFPALALPHRSRILVF
jgi:hypothetical protein